ncbi:MAG TPA: hypothetical protein VJR46_04570 [Candidatus Dormibacteraeota bacterium]|nr:hypothetical protein [Candidatus Dormibacteraeota bacterium]
MRWRKRGLLIEAPSHLPWARTHAAIPIAVPLGGSRAEVYFSARDERNRAQIGRARVELDAPGATPEFDPEPIVRFGPRGAFDDCGVTAGCLVEHRQRRYLYYSGWSLAVEVPFLFYIGCAVSEDGGATYARVSPAPVLGRSSIDPLLTASPSILVEGGIWRMWYVSGTGWDGAEPSYNIRYAESSDGVEWRPTARTCIDYSYPGEHAIARPHVMRDGALYRMWFSHRGASYRIGYAESLDGLEWTRKDDEAGITVSSQGWDSEMVAYPWVGDVGGTLRMLYNGNSYGRTGIGHAIVERG